MDHPRPAIATGLRFVLVDVDGTAVPMPRNGGFVARGSRTGRDGVGERVPGF